MRHDGWYCDVMAAFASTAGKDLDVEKYKVTVVCRWKNCEKCGGLFQEDSAPGSDTSRSPEPFENRPGPWRRRPVAKWGRRLVGGFLRRSQGLGSKCLSIREGCWLMGAVVGDVMEEVEDGEQSQDQ